MAKPYKDLSISVLRFCKDTIDLLANGTTFVNFDAAPDENQLPQNDVLGPMALSFNLDDHFINGSFQVGISTWTDPNNFRLLDGMSLLLDRLLPTTRIQVYDATTGAVAGKLVIESPVQLMPTLAGRSRPLQFIMVNFSTTRTYNLTT